jgi:hypothetical protein
MPTELKKQLQAGQKIVLRIRVSPKSGRHEIGKTMADGSLKIKLKSAPEKGKANAELIELLSEYFEVPSNRITITSGDTSRIKLVEIR